MNANLNAQAQLIEMMGGKKINLSFFEQEEPILSELGFVENKVSAKHNDS